MKTYRGDLHIHTQLSPCGSLNNSPAVIIQKALEKQLDFIGITDHNTTRQALLVQEMAAEKGLTVFTGVEINTREEVHCLAFFNSAEALNQMQVYIDKHLPPIPNKPEYFGYQVAVDRNERIIYTEERLLHSALDVSIDEVAKQVQQLKGIFIPAHIDRRGNGLISQLGFVPENLQYDALEIFRNSDPAEIRLMLKLSSQVCLIKNSDAHFPEDIGRAYTQFEMNQLNFEGLREALQHNRIII